MLAKKLAVLTATVVPLTSLADLVTPAWDERVMVPVFKGPEWLLCGSVFAGFVVVSALMFVVMRRKGRPIMEFAVLETMIAAGFTVLLIWCKGLGFSYEERVIHHPADDSDRRVRYTCPSCGGPRSIWHGLCAKCEERSRRMTAAEEEFKRWADRQSPHLSCSENAVLFKWQSFVCRKERRNWEDAFGRSAEFKWTDDSRELMPAGFGDFVDKSVDITDKSIGASWPDVDIRHVLLNKVGKHELDYEHRFQHDYLYPRSQK